MFLFVVFTLILTLSAGVFCVEDEEGLIDDDTLRERREYLPEAWRVMEERMDMSGWIPQESSSESREVPLIKRRRLRKRKRRPPHITMSSEHIRPQEEQSPRESSELSLELSKNEEVWNDMQQENLKESNRRRTTPTYDSSSLPEDRIHEKIVENNEEIDSTTQNHSYSSGSGMANFQAHEKIRDPFDALKEAEEKQKTPEEMKQFTIIPDLKALLKKTVGSISLSEILQQKNLSLSELLSGKSDAILALTESSESTIITEASTENDASTLRYNRVPPSERKKLTNRVFSQSGESYEDNSSQKALDNQKKRLSLLNDRRENSLPFVVTRTLEVVTEPITETRIFIPSQPKYQQVTQRMAHRYTTTEPTKEERDNAVSSNTIVPPKSIFRKLPLTSAKLMARTTSTSPTRPYYPRTTQVALQNIPEREPLLQKENPDVPTKVSLGLNLSHKSVDQDPEPSLQIQELDYNEPKIITAREEILQILKDPYYKDRLSRILHERNMTVQELVEQRERGSSQLHLADIFHNKTREPEPLEQAYIGVVKTDISENARVPKGRIFDENTEGLKDLETYHTKSTNQIKSTETLETDMKIPSVSTNSEQIPINNIDLNKTINYAAIMPFWKQFHPTMFKQFYHSDNIKSWNIPPLDGIGRGVSADMDTKPDMDLRTNNYYLDEESYFAVPTGVKSALAASFVIVGLSIVMFLTIFIIFKWTQRKKNNLTYMSSLSGGKIRAPILNVSSKNGLKSFMCETLGRKTNFYKSHLQSMTDAWDDRKQKF